MVPQLACFEEEAYRGRRYPQREPSGNRSLRSRADQSQDSGVGAWGRGRGVRPTYGNRQVPGVAAAALLPQGTVAVGQPHINF